MARLGETAELGQPSGLQQFAQGFGAGITGTPLSRIQKNARERQLLERLQQQRNNPQVLQGEAAKGLAISDPDRFQKVAKALNTTDQLGVQATFDFGLKLDTLFKAGRFQDVLGAFQKRIEAGQAVGRDMTETIEIADRYQKALSSGDEKGIEDVVGENATLVASGRALGALPQLPKKEAGFTLGPGQKRFTAEGEEVAAVAPKGMADGKSKFIGTPSRTTKDGKNFLSGVVQRSDGSFGIEEVPVAGDFVSIIGETGEELTGRKIREAGGKKEAELKSQIKFTPLLKTAIKEAQVKASIKGEALTDFARAEAALPGLKESISQLKELAPIATSTLGGRAFDVAIKETGFGSTKGANARVKFIAIINNQILPLLRLTFGAQFTEREGETLKATMGDPNATPEQKALQLETFIEQKIKSLQTAQRQAGLEVTPTEELKTDQPATGEVKFLGFE